MKWIVDNFADSKYTSPVLIIEAMPIRPRQLESLLQSKFGFSPAKGHSSDHKWYELYLPGCGTILTKVSHSARELGPKIEGMIIRQLRVNRSFFNGMIDCSKEREDYHNHLQSTSGSLIIRH
jgi:hypothetical protein